MQINSQDYFSKAITSKTKEKKEMFVNKRDAFNNFSSIFFFESRINFIF